MMTHRILVTFILYLVLINASGQNSVSNFKVLDSIVLNETTSKVLQNKLETLQLKFIPSRSSISLLFDRDVDFNFRHHRLDIRLNNEEFQIDLLTRNDTIFVRTIRSFYNQYDFDNSTLAFDSSLSHEIVNEYLSQRNKFYRSKKSLKDLVKEISEYRVYAFYCGDGAPLTGEGRRIGKLVEEEKIDELLKMLQSICVETQAYGVSGFEMLDYNDYPIAFYARKIIKRIKKRNSETLVCNGCLSGLVMKIYTNK